MKKLNKIVSIILATLMLVAVIPMSAGADDAIVETTPEVKYTKALDETKLLLGLDSLADTENNVDGGQQIGDIHKRSENQRETADGSLNAVTNARAWRAWVRDTGLTLNSSSKYTITYTMDVPENVSAKNCYTMMGFTFQADGNASLTMWKSLNNAGATSGEDTSYNVFLSTSNNSGYKASNAVGGVLSPNTYDFAGEHDFIISIDGTSVEFYMDGNKIYANENVTYAADKNLAVGIHAHNDFTGLTVSAETPKEVCKLTNIKVYDGAYHNNEEAVTKTEVVAMQYTEAKTDLQSVRFISRLSADAFNKGTKAGFKVVAVYKDGDKVYDGKNWEKDVKVVYSSILATDETGNAVDVEASEWDSEYLLAFALNKVPTYEQIDFYVQTYVEVDGVEVLSTEARFTMQNGIAVEGAEALEIPQS